MDALGEGKENDPESKIVPARTVRVSGRYLGGEGGVSHRRSRGGG